MLKSCADTYAVDGIDRALPVLADIVVVAGVLGFADRYRSPELSVHGVDQPTAAPVADLVVPVGPLP